MKTSSLIITLPAFVLAAAISTNLSQAQTAASPVLASKISQPTLPAPTPYTVVSRDANSALWERTVYKLSPSGRVVPHKHGYTELATGLNYQVNGQWVPSKQEIDILSDGTAVANQGPHTVTFPGDIAQDVITLTTPDGLKLETRPIALSYDDSSNTVLIAVLTNSPGYLVGTNQVIYPNAFSGLRADLLYTYTRAGFEQNIVLEEQPPLPAFFGLNPQTSRLQVLTEFFNPPTPNVTTVAIPTAAGNLTNQNLDFGIMKMKPGNAFMLGTNAPSASVSKQWLNMDGRQFLLEEVPVSSIAGELSQLPAPQATSAKSNTNSLLNVVSAKRLLPPPRLVKTGPGTRIQIGRAVSPARGLVMDWQAVNGSLTNYTFQGDTTYYVSGPVYFYSPNMYVLSTNTFEGGAVIKYGGAHNASLNFIYPATIQTLSTPYHPVIFTSRSDNSVGDDVGGSGYSSGNPALSLDGTSSGICAYLTLSNFRIANASTAIWASGVGVCITLNNGQIVSCGTGVSSPGDGATYLNNMLFANNGTALSESYMFIGVACSTLAYNYCMVYNSEAGTYCNTYFGDCIMAGDSFLSDGDGDVSLNGDHNGFYYDGEEGDSTFGDPGSIFISNDYPYCPFQNAGGGYYYLNPNNNPFINVGTCLLGYLGQKTTRAPIVYSGSTISTNLPLSPQVQRDTSNAPDLGYHYDPVDYLLVGVVVTNATVTVNPGTVIALAVPGWGCSGLDVEGGAQFNCQGLANNLNRIVEYNTVQEGLNNAFLYPIGFQHYTLVYDSWEGYSTGATFNFRFTDWSMLGQDNYFFVLQNNSVGNFRDCQFHSAFLAVWLAWNPSVNLTNCLFERVWADLEPGSDTNSFVIRNNLFWNGVFEFSTSVSNNATIKDNLFDRTAFTNCSVSIPFNGGYNAYVTNYPRLWLTFTNDVILSSPLAYQSSWFGNYYQPTNSPLIHAGSTSASNVGLYHYTVTTNQVVEGTNTVSIGYHYVATDQYGNPLDSNGDGIPDYLEDANGNGIYDFGDLGDWQNTLYLKVLITRPRNNSIIP
jgi:hypothetical protein